MFIGIVLWGIKCSSLVLSFFSAHKLYLYPEDYCMEPTQGNTLCSSKWNVCLNDEKPHSCLALINLSSIFFDGESD